MIVHLTEIMPQAVRTAGFSLAYSLAAALFGGFTPAISTGLIHLTGNQAMGGLWLSAAAVCGLVGAGLAGWGTGAAPGRPAALEHDRRLGTADHAG